LICVFLQDVIEHVFDPDELIMQIKRVLKPGGYIILSTPNLSLIVNRFSLLFGFMPACMEVSTKHIFGRPGSCAVGHIRCFTYRALQEFFLFYGFEIVTMFTYPAYFSGEGPTLAKVVHVVDKLSRVLGKRYSNQIFMVAKKR
jgi:SAM-dependent methyltransferase